MKTALLIIATNPPYWGYARTFIQSVREHFIPCDVIAFTDAPCSLGEDKRIGLPSYDWNKATLLRYHTVLGQSMLLREYDYLSYCDVDMRFCGKVVETDVVSDGLTVVEHPSYVGVPGTDCDFEIDPRSAASLTDTERRSAKYYCGGFQVAPASLYLEMAEFCRINIERDRAQNFTARWTDESHINRWLHNRPPAKVLSIAYCWPDQQWRVDRLKHIWLKYYGPNFLNEVQPKLIAVEKSGSVPPQPKPADAQKMMVRRLELQRLQRADARKGIFWKPGEFEARLEGRHQ